MPRALHYYSIDFGLEGGFFELSGGRIRSTANFDDNGVTMTKTTQSKEQQIAQTVRNICIRASLEGYENATASGLCHEGAWEAAISAMRMLDLDAILETVRNGDTKSRN